MSRLQMYLSFAGTAVVTYIVAMRLCYSQCHSTEAVTAAIGTMNTLNNDQLLARIAVLTEASTQAARDLATAQAELKGCKSRLRATELDLEDSRQAARELQAQADQLTARVAQAETRDATCQSKLRDSNLRRAQEITNRPIDTSAPPPVQADCPPAAGGDSAPQAAAFVWGKAPTLPQCTGPPSNSGPQPSKSSVQCYQSSDWAEVCVYDLLCTDGDKPVLISDTEQPGKSAWGHWGVGDVAEGYHVFDVFPRPPPPSRDIPLNSRARPYYLPSSALRTAEFTDRAFWLIEPEYRTWEMQHLFFFSHGVFPMWEALQSNASWGGGVPPIQDVYYMVKAKYHFNDWNTNVLDIIVPKTGTVHYMDDLEGYSKDRLLCTRRGVLASNKPNLFSGMKSAHAFRAAAYKKYGLRMPSQPPKKLVIFNRANAGRRFENMAEMEALFKRYSVPFEVVSKHGTFEKQVRTMASAGVLILAHGAAATNTMFQPHRSVVVEVFPYLRKRFGFKTVADVIGNFYMPIYTFQKPQSGKDVMNKTEWLTNCETISGIKTNAVGTCDQAQKVVTIRVDIPTLERTIIDAFDVIGYRIYDSQAGHGGGGDREQQPFNQW